MNKKILAILLFFSLSITQNETKAPSSKQKQQKKSQQLKEHKALQKEFLTLQHDAGIITPATIVNSIRKPATQEQLNIVRSTLNNLLSKTTLNDADNKALERNINLLDSYNPSQWPRAEDYRELLNVKINVPSIFKTFEETQQEFKEIQEQLGIHISKEKLESIRKIKGKKAAQPQFDAVRSELNKILKKDKLTEADVKEANKKIKELKGLNPEFWPGPDDYKALLKLKM